MEDGSMDQVNVALEQVDKEILVFQRNLEYAQQRKLDLAKEQEEKKASEAAKEREIIEYEQQIADLKRQLAGAEETSAAEEEVEEIEEIVEEIVEYVEEEEVTEYEEITEHEGSTSTAPPVGVYDKVEQKPTPAPTSTVSAPQFQPYNKGLLKPASNSQKEQMAGVKKHNDERLAWKKPCWAKGGVDKLERVGKGVPLNPQPKPQDPETMACNFPKKPPAKEAKASGAVEEEPSQSAAPAKKKFGLFKRAASKKSVKAEATPASGDGSTSDETKRLGFFAKAPQPTKKTTVYKKVAVGMGVDIDGKDLQKQPSSPQSKPNTKIAESTSTSPKNKYAWSKPAWALPQAALDKDVAPDTEGAISSQSIQNNILKPGAGTQGRERKVFAKVVRRVDGKFQKPADKVPPRLAWIVVFEGRRKIGKIVVHLYGREVGGLVDQFLQLKGETIQRCNDANNTELVVRDVKPNFFVTTDTKGLINRHGCVGLVQEGQDVLNTILNADPKLHFFVKQAHIFPVKKAQG